MKLNHILIFIVSGLLLSCTERIDVDIEPGFKRFVVEGTITTDTTQHTIQLSSSGDYLIDKPTPKISDARVFVLAGEDTIKYTSLNNKGLYGTASNVFGIPGQTYQLVVEGVDIDEDGIEELYTAECTMPMTGTLDSITFGYNPNITAWSINLWAMEPPEDNWYIFKAAINHKIVTDTITEWFLQEDALFNGNSTNGIFVQFLNGAGEEVALNDTITLELHSITREYYQFVSTLQSEVFGSNPLFGGPPANIIGNISNGALGFFSAQVLLRESKVVDSIPTIPSGGFGPQ